jgi:hypothetical protein
VRERIEGDAAFVAGRVVAEASGYPSVGELMRRGEHPQQKDVDERVLDLRGMQSVSKPAGLPAARHGGPEQEQGENRQHRYYGDESDDQL